jgi:hypothetical protein
MPGRLNISNETVDGLVSRYQDGTSVAALVEETPYSTTTILRRLRERGVPIRGWREAHALRRGGCGWERGTTPHSVQRPSARDLGWIAGFLEGEGSFLRSNSGSEVVIAGQVQMEPLERLQRFLGGNIRVRKNGRTGPGGVGRAGDFGEWRISGSRARGVMMTLYPMMSPRRCGQICTALNRKGRYPLGQRAAL